MTRHFYKLVLALSIVCAWAAPVAAQLGDAAQPKGEARTEAEDFAELPGDGLDWTANPGAFERSLRRRDQNPLFPPARRFVTPDELRSAIIQDAGDARQVLLEFVDLALKQRRLGRLSDAGEIREALARVDQSIRSTAETGGSAYRLAAEMQQIRSQLLMKWRETNAENEQILALLTEAEDEIAEWIPLENNPFVAQLMREDGPIPPQDLASALLSEDVATITLAMEFLEPERRSAAQRDSRAALSYVQLDGAEIEDLDARLQALR